MAGTTNKYVLAERYATALFSLGSEKKKLKALEHDIEMLQTLYNESPMFQQLTRNPVVSRSSLAASARSLFEAYKLSPEGVRFGEVLAENRRLHLIPEVASAFEGMLRASRNQVKARVTSAQKLSSKQLSSIKAALEKKTGKEVALDADVDASILGGVKIQIGSKLFDDSLAGKLERLKQLQRSVQHQH